ncbi:MAG: malate dehydrogenase [Peptococcaceae bacterium BICA1-7]|nr:MAG: malate dehydrogenase [Peptococcaceae bacterium BICA1-7]HBV96002.1 NAD-dependent malic enzyme [Desulfotomaculum sp.]
MIMSLNIVIRFLLPNRPGILASVLAVIAREGGSIGNIDLVSASPNLLTRDIMIRLHDKKSIDGLVNALGNIPDIRLIHIADRVFTRHLGGKINIQPQKPVIDWEDLSLVYTPGVAEISEAIAGDPGMAYRLTMKGNSLAIITDGSAVLGLGNLGAAAALPVMEGKAMLFKKFADINAFPLCLGVQDSQGIIDAVVALAPSFGGINLEDIAAPKCFEIEEALARLLDIPVFHDDQHGTAIVALAGLLNALKVVGKDIKGIRVVISGAGAAGVSIAKILLSAGVCDIVVCDRKGAISRDNPPTQSSKLWLALNTNNRCIHGSLKEVVAGADVFIGVSGPGLLVREDVLNMANSPIVFALANPNPEIYPESILDVAGVVATGRSDYPNQINNALAFPGVFRGALDCSARAINHEMCLAAAYALAGLMDSEQLSADNIIPSVFNDKVSPALAKAVKEMAKQTGVARDFLNMDN